MGPLTAGDRLRGPVSALALLAGAYAKALKCWPSPIVLNRVAICCAWALSVDERTETAIELVRPPLGVIAETAVLIAELFIPPFCAPDQANARGAGVPMTRDTFLEAWG